MNSHFFNMSGHTMEIHFINSNVNFGILNRVPIDLSVPSHTMLVNCLPEISWPESEVHFSVK